jgi:hypothetical protein
MMKKIISIAFLIIFILAGKALANKADILQDPEYNNTLNQNVITTATLTTSSRLFKAKEDLTSVILVIPSGSIVTVLGSDSTYLHVTYEENEGFILKRHAVIDKSPVVTTQVAATQPKVQETQPLQTQVMNRFTYLENKYGTSMAARLYAGKIWKGMNSEMVKDSWGSAIKINREVSGNVIKEEWIYKTTWLYFENNTLVDWGPVMK